MSAQVKQIPPINQTQPVDPNANVTFTITIGNAQIGSSLIVDSRNNIIAKGDKINVNLGRGSNLRGNFITVYTNVLDANNIDPNNGVIVVNSFSNRLNSFMYVETAPQGGLVSFTIRYNFI